MSSLNRSQTKNGPKDFKMHILGSKLQNLNYFLHIVVSGLKVIIGFRHPVTIGIYISSEISKTSHPVLVTKKFDHFSEIPSHTG